MAAKKNRGRQPSTKYITHYFATKKTRRCSYTIALPSSEQQKLQQVPEKIEGVRLRKSRWIAEIKHPDKKYVRIWLGSYATPEEASQVYQSKKMEFEEIKFQATVTTKDKELVGDQEAESDAESSPDVTIKGKNIDDEEVVFDNQEAMRAVDFNVLEESKAESLFDDGDVAVNLVGFDDRVADYQGEKSLSRGKVVVIQEFGDMLLELGPVLINKYGYILGEFSWMDDLSITT